MATQISATVLTAKGELRKANLSLEEGRLTVETLQKYMRKKDSPEPVLTIPDPVTRLSLTLFGYKKGKSDTENKTVFPTKLGDTPLYGDVVVVATTTTWETPVSYLPAQWETFMEGQDDEDEAEVDEEEEEDAEEEEEEDVEEDKDDEVDEVEDDEIEEEEEMEPEPILPKRKKGAIPAHLKVDMNAFREELDVNAPIDSHPLRQLYYSKLQFLTPTYGEEAVRGLERAMVLQATEQAKKLYIPRNWKALTFRLLYKSVCRSILWNIHPSSLVQNQRLLARCSAGEFTLDRIASMTAYDMFPEHWRDLADKQLIREQKILEGNKSRATDEYKCKQCGKRECTYYEMQTRSADEPTTIFISCLNCGKRWRH
jgi:DNA-directed RNA polymerase subunit M/transcription elongation factor TFIIS